MNANSVDAAKITVLHCDMRKVPQSNMERSKDKAIKCSVQVEVRVSTTQVTVTVTSGTAIVAGPERFPLSFSPSGSA